jgi:transposase
VYIDESGVEDTLFRQYARALRGTQIIYDIKGKKSCRISMIAGLLGKKMIAPLSFEGYTNADVFNHWLEHCLAPELPPNHTVIIDNASFHKSTKTKETIEKAGCKLIFLPPYSPDLNPIENWWAILKTHIRTALKETKNLSQAIQIAFQNMNYHKM